ncbi:photosystem II biogenesis protein Psp29 [Trichothermofontia sp.]
MNNVRTVSDTKRSFYSLHTRPINTIYRRVVEELIVEMHLLSVNVDFRPDPVYAVGVVTSFDRFMQGYQPAKDQASIFQALCRAIEADPDRLRQDADRLRDLAKHLPVDELIDWLCLQSHRDDVADLQAYLRAIAENPRFKYSRLFAIGLFSLLEWSDPDLTKDDARLAQTLEKIGETLKVPVDKFQRDLELYRSNLEKMQQAQAVMADAIAAERKRREQREQAQQDAVAPSPDNAAESA